MKFQTKGSAVTELDLLDAFPRSIGSPIPYIPLGTGPVRAYNQTMHGTEIALRLIREEREKPTGFLDLGNLGLTELPDELFQLTHLRRLNLGWGFGDEEGAYRDSTNHEGYNRVTVLPEAIGRLDRLTHLWLQLNPITSLGPLRHLAALQTLNCSGTQVKNLKPLAGLTALQSLECGNSAVEDLQPLADLTTLQSLECWNTLVRDLKPLAGLKGLKSLGFSLTQVTDLQPLAGLVALQSLACLGIAVHGLQPLAGLTALQSLNCSSTPVEDLQPLAGLTALRFLSFWDTRVKDLQPLAGLTALQSISCSGTRVDDLQPLAVLTALQSLDCQATLVNDLQPLGGLTALHSLDCSNTPVNDLQPLASLTPLRSLNCSSTRVRDLSPLLAQSKLERLSANFCQLADLPRGLIFKMSLQRLHLQKSVIPGIPAEVLSADLSDNCLERLRHHLTDLDAGAEEVREAKLIVLGNGRVGKTQICRRLRGLPYDESVPSTHGITVTTDPWVGSAEGESLNLWDFGGQDIYHGAHALFMRTRAIFLVVWHPDFEGVNGGGEGPATRNYPLSYWLEYVRTLGREDSPVIVVQAQCDRAEQEAKSLPVEIRFLEPFRFVKRCEYSAKKDRCRGALNDAILEAIRYLRERDGVSTIGAGRRRVLDQLEAWRIEDQRLAPGARQHRTLTQTEFRRLCEAKGGVTSPESLLDYLHNLGAVFYRKNLFLDRIILDQSWALDAVYAVFDREKSHRHLVGAHGRFTRSLLELLVWGEYSDPEQRLFLSLMESCGICFVRRPENQEQRLEAEYMAPDLLPARESVATQLDGRWQERDPSAVSNHSLVLFGGMPPTPMITATRDGKANGRRRWPPDREGQVCWSNPDPNFARLQHLIFSVGLEV